MFLECHPTALKPIVLLNGRSRPDGEPYVIEFISSERDDPTTTPPCFSLNVNGDWIDVRNEGIVVPRVIISYNGEPVVSERCNGTGAYEFIVEEGDSRTVYNVELHTIGQAVSYTVKRSGKLLLVTEFTHDSIPSR